MAVTNQDTTAYLNMDNNGIFGDTSTVKTCTGFKSYIYTYILVKLHI